MIGISVSLRQASLLSLHSLSYVTPSPPQTGSYSSPQLGHSQNAKSPLSTQIEWWLQDRLLQGPWESKKKMGTFDTKVLEECILYLVIGIFFLTTFANHYKRYGLPTKCLCKQRKKLLVFVLPYLNKMYSSAQDVLYKFTNKLAPQFLSMTVAWRW